MTNSTIEVDGNDYCMGGVVELVYDRTAPVSPLVLTFTREDGIVSTIALHHCSVREMMKLIINNW